MYYENWISYRYLTATKGGFISFLKIVSIAGIALGVMALIVVTGVMTGFGNNLREKIIGTTAHIVIEKETGVNNYEEIIDKVIGIEGVKGAAPFFQGSIFLEQDGRAMGLTMRGIDPQREGEVTKIKDYLVDGELAQLGQEGVIVGTELARFFGLRLGDTVTFITPSSGISGGQWRTNLKIVGIFKSGMVDYDMNLVLCHLDRAQKMFNLAEGEVSGIGLKISDPYQAKEMKAAIYDAIGFSFLVKSWIDVNRNLFEALRLEKLGLFIILTLMVLVASFNIVSTLIVTVSSKIHDIGILKSVGVPSRSIKKIFINLGVFIGSFGTLLGLVLGVAVSYLLRTYFPVPEQIYAIDHVPVELQLVDILMIVTAAFVIIYVSTIYPASRAARLQPVDALRYE